MEVIQGSNRRIPRDPKPYSLEWWHAEPLPETMAKLSEIRKGESVDAKTILQWVMDPDERVVAAVARFYGQKLWAIQDPELESGELPAIIWARAIHKAKEKKVFWTPLIDNCANYLAIPNKKQYNKSVKARKISPDYLSEGYCKKQIEDWARAFATSEHLLELLEFHHDSMVGNVFKFAGGIDRTVLDKVEEREGAFGFGPVLENPNLDKDLGAYIVKRLLDALESKLPDEEILKKERLFFEGHEEGAVASEMLRFLIEKKPEIVPKGTIRKMANMAVRGCDNARFWAAYALFVSTSPGARLTRVAGKQLVEYPVLADEVIERGGRELKKNIVSRYLLANCTDGEILSSVIRNIKWGFGYWEREKPRKRLGDVKSTADRQELGKALFTLMMHDPEFALEEISNRDDCEFEKVEVSEEDLKAVLTSPKREVRAAAVLTLPKLVLQRDEQNRDNKSRAL